MSVDATFSILREGLEGRSVAATLKTYVGTLAVVAILGLFVSISVGVENLFRLTPLVVAVVVAAEYCISAASHGYLVKVQTSARQVASKLTQLETHASARPSDSGRASDQFLADLADEIDQLGIGNLLPSEPAKEALDEFGAELDEIDAEDEDLETHYNLGIAFREMGLLEEAISEFQKVADATEHGKPFRYLMQCCTLLGLAFMEKGQPAMAVIWYERALRTPGIDPESSLALRYDLGVAQESAGAREQALHTLSIVYEMAKDYRDVGQRVRALEEETESNDV